MKDNHIIKQLLWVIDDWEPVSLDSHVTECQVRKYKPGAFLFLKVETPFSIAVSMLREGERVYLMSFIFKMRIF